MAHWNDCKIKIDRFSRNTSKLNLRLYNNKDKIEINSNK